jgi:hypothetical protein
MTQRRTNMKRTALKLVAAIVAVYAVAAPAMATTNLFTPVSGAAFQQEGGQVSSNTVVLSQGTMYSCDYSNNLTIEASLGHANGGANNFLVSVLQNNNSATCWVLGNYDLWSGSFTQWSTGQSVGGTPGQILPMTISTNFSGATYGVSYSVYCQLPPVNGGCAGIVGVTPSN